MALGYVGLQVHLELISNGGVLRSIVIVGATKIRRPCVKISLLIRKWK